jgi:predicted NodU family carbamoyl transferase
MPKQPKPSKLIFMVKTAKRRTQPEEFKGELKMEHEQCHAWYKYISSELQKIATLLNDHTWPPGHVSATTFTPKPAVASTTQTTPTTTEVNPFEE